MDVAIYMMYVFMFHVMYVQWHAFYFYDTFLDFTYAY